MTTRIAARQEIFPIFNFQPSAGQTTIRRASRPKEFQLLSRTAPKVLRTMAGALGNHNCTNRCAPNIFTNFQFSAGRWADCRSARNSPQGTSTALSKPRPKCYEPRPQGWETITARIDALQDLFPIFNFQPGAGQTTDRHALRPKECQLLSTNRAQSATNPGRSALGNHNCTNRCAPRKFSRFSMFSRALG